MKVFYQLALLLAGFAFITSCSESDFDRKPVLNVLQKTLSFTNAAEEKSVEVEVNDGDELLHVITSASGIDWIKVTNTEGGLKVSVLDNKTLEKREATIKVLLLKGTLSETITVNQSEGEYYINVSKEKVEFENVESEVTIFVDANVDWTVSMDAAITWLTIDKSEEGKNKLTFKALDNATNKKQLAEIKIAGSGKEQIIVITQKGQMYYDFPFMNIGYIFDGPESERGILYKNSMGDANEFELARKSTAAGINAGVVFRYRTKSPIFPVTEYMIYNLGSLPIKSIRFAIANSPVIDPMTLLEDPDFLEHLEIEGFEFAWKDEEVHNAVYWNKERRIAMEVIGKKPSVSAALGFTYSHVKPSNPNNQEEKYDVFTALPSFYTEWGATVEQIKAWEEAKGSRFLPEDSNADFMLAFAPDPALEPDVIERVYTMDRTSSPTRLISTLLLISNTEKALFPTGIVTEYNMYKPSKEFKTLMDANGYRYAGQVPSSPIFEFINDAKSLTCKPTIQRFYNEGFLPRLCLEITPTVIGGDDE